VAYFYVQNCIKMPILPELSEIKILRKKLNLTQEELCAILKIPQATISRIENGIGNPSYYSVKMIFDYLEREELRRKTFERKAKSIMTTEIVSIDAKSSIKDAVELMNTNDLSQLPILEDNQNLGSITSKKIQKAITDNPELMNASVEIIKELPFPEIEKDWDIKGISNLLTNYPAVLVKEFGNYIGIITDADFLKFA